VQPKPTISVLVVEEVAPHLRLEGRGEDLVGEWVRGGVSEDVDSRRVIRVLR